MWLRIKLRTLIFFEALLTLNKHVVNFLSSAKFYIAQISSHVSRCTTNPEAKASANHAQSIYRKVLGAEVEATISNLFSGDEVYMVARDVYNK